MSGVSLDALHERAILASLAGAPFLCVFGVAWIVAGGLSYFLPSAIAPWVYLFQGIPAAPLAIALERRVGYAKIEGDDPLLPLTLQILFIQVVAFPAILLVLDLAPAFVPVAFAAITGAHFLPFQWIYRTSLYLILGIVVSAGPYLMAFFVGQQVLHLTGFFVGISLLIGAVAARAHAKATWERSRRPVVGGMGS